MLNQKRIIVILPAFNAENTLRKTYEEIPMDIVDEVILVDDSSTDATVNLAHELGITHIQQHESNKGYGANQKSCYRIAMKLNPDIVLMLHPDYQYSPRLIPELCSPIVDGVYQVTLGSRILGGGALHGGMPLYKYVSNRVLTFIQNLLMGQHLSEYHTGYRAFSSEIFREIPFESNSDGFVFDNEFLSQILMKGYNVGEIGCPTRYERDSSKINFFNSVTYGIGVLKVSLLYFLHKKGIIRSGLFSTSKRVTV